MRRPLSRDPHRTLVTHSAAAHRAIDRLFAALARGARHGDVARRVLDDGIAAGATMLRAHHDLEEEVILPLLRSKGADGPWDTIATEHEALTGALEGAITARGGRAELLEALHALVVPHMEGEEEVLTESYWRELLSADEARAFGKDIAAHSKAHLTPATKMLPLVLYNLDPEERAAFTEPMPGFLVNGLVPYAFRAAWRPLRPFMAYPPRRLSPLP